MRCLLITPMRFYLFHEIFRTALEARGYDVSIVCDLYPKKIYIIGLLLGKYIPSMSKLLTLRFFKKYLRHNGEYDLAIIVKGRGISIEMINLLRNHAKRILGYNFDSFRLFPSPLQCMKSIDKYATFDHRDSH